MTTITIKSEMAQKFFERVSISGAEVVKFFGGEVKSGKIIIADLVSKDSCRQMRVATPVTSDGDISGFTVKVADICQLASAIMAYDREADLKIKVSDGGVKVGLSVGKVSMDVSTVEEGASVEAVGSDTLFTAQLGRKALLSVLKHNHFYDVDSEQTMSINFNVTDEVLAGACTDKCVFVKQEMAVDNCKHGTIWEKAEKEGGVAFAINGLLANVLERSLASSEQEKVIVTVDTKYLHLMYDAGCLASVRLAKSTSNTSTADVILGSKSSCVFAVDKAQLDSAIKIMATKLTLSKGVGEDVPVLLSGDKNGLVLSIGDNRVPVACGEGSAEGVDIYVAPNILKDAIGVADAGNIRVSVNDVETPKGVKHFLTIGNGTVADGIRKDSAAVIAAPIDSATGEKEQARFAMGKTKADAKKQTEETESVKKAS